MANPQGRNGRGGTGKAEYVPTPEQIRAACAEIQAEWDEATEYLRRTSRPIGRTIAGLSGGWTPPTINRPKWRSRRRGKP